MGSGTNKNVSIFINVSSITGIVKIGNLKKL